MTSAVISLPVRKTLAVRTSVEDAFAVFTEDVDSWWPRTHHIGATPMTRITIEGRQGGRCFTKHEDGTERDWGRVLAWEPPRRLMFSWQMTHDWKYEPDVARSSEVEVRFVPIGRDATRIELEHRFFDRHGEGGSVIRGNVDAPNGWTLVTSLYAQRVGVLENPT